MIVNGQSLLQAAPIKDMLDRKIITPGKPSHGLVEAGYDIRIKEDIWFWPAGYSHEISRSYVIPPSYSFGFEDQRIVGNFCLGSTIEEFQMPMDLVGIVHDKSTWARHGLSVFNTVIEPGWKGFLTLELVYHGQADLYIPAGSGIAQVIFHRLEVPAVYAGKYQNQEAGPQGPR